MKKQLLLIVCLISTIAYSQIQKGEDIDGEAAGDVSGHSISMPDINTVAIGAISNAGNGTNSGHVRVYSWIGSEWTQKGDDIDGEEAGDLSGCSVSMPDSNTVAIGAYRNDGNGSNAGHVRIYSWNGSEWIQKGEDIDGEAVGDESGWAVSMSDSNTVAIGAHLNEGGGSDNGHVRVYSWNGSAWVQKGSDIDGETFTDRSGYSVNMADSNTVAIGARLNDGDDFGANFGHVRIYSWNGSDWIQKGDDIDGEAAGDVSGESVSMPDSNTVAIGATGNDGSGTDAGHVRVFSWNGSDWIQKGDAINGEAPGDGLGWSVSMPDSNTVAVGSIFNDGNGTESGHVRVYTWDGSVWNQKGIDLDGEAAGDGLGWSLSMPDTSTVGIGARYNGGNGFQAGHVRVYNFCTETTSMQIETVCDSLVSPSGNYTWTTSGIYMDTITNITGCDSVMTFDLTVNHSSTASFAQTTCDSLVSPSGNYIWTTSGIYMDTIPNMIGCDSIMTFDLTINYASSSTITETVCDSLVSPSGNYIWTTSGIYMDTIPNVIGCDSVMTFDLTVNYASSASITQFVCDSLVSPSGNYTWTTTGIYMDTIPNVAGCDSVMTFDLTVNHSSSASFTQTICDSLVSPSGNYIWTASGIYMDTIPNLAGCDSIMTFDLTVNDVSDLTTTTSGLTITANNTVASYQWLNCDDNSIIEGETDQSFTAIENGNYAVILTEDGCVDTSACVSITTVAVNENSLNEISVYPNPTDGNFTIDLGHIYQTSRVSITNVSGQLIESKTLSQSQLLHLSIEEPAGIYFIFIQSDDKNAVVRLLKE